MFIRHLPIALQIAAILLLGVSAPAAGQSSLQTEINLYYVGWLIGILIFVSVLLTVWIKGIRRTAEQQTTRLRESEERFRVLFEDTQQAVTLIENERFIAANKAAMRMLGIAKQDQLIGLRPLDISPPKQPDGQDSVDKEKSVIRTAFQQGSNQFKWAHLRANGEPFLVQVLLTVIRQNNNNLLHVVWTDITEKEKAQQELAKYRHNLELLVAERTYELGKITASLSETSEALRKTNEQQQAIFDSTSSGISLILNRTVMHCNRRMEEIFGYASGEMTGQGTQHWYQDQATYEKIGAETRQQISNHGIFRTEQLLVRKDGSTFWGRMIAKPLEPNDPSHGFVGTIDDITAEHAAVNAMHQAQALAEEAARTKADFLANMSHEIRTPMNAIIGLTHLALQKNPPPNQRDYLNKIHSSSQHLLGIINEILDFSKIDAGKLTLEKISFELDDILDHVVSLISQRCTQKGLKLNLEVSADVPRHLIGDPLRIGQILINFANNAVKFTERGEISIQVEVKQEPAACRTSVVDSENRPLHAHFSPDSPQQGCSITQEVSQIGAVAAALPLIHPGTLQPTKQKSDHLLEQETTLLFSVHDTGIGLSPAQQSRLFQSFHQADNSTTRKYGGTGLGLVISKRLAELMGGNVGVDSSPGQGATFWFSTRLGFSEYARTANSPPPMIAPSQADFAGIRVLLVEDNDINQEVAMEMLSNLGLAVDIAENGAIALEKLQTAGFDIVLMDMQMPVMDGPTASREIRKLPKLANLPIIAVTANAMEQDRKECLAAGMNDYLAKPIDPDELTSMLLKWTSKQSASASPELAEKPNEPNNDNLQARLEAIPGLDMKVGLKTSMGRVEFYARLLDKFSQSTSAKALIQALHEEDRDTAIRAAHTLKGVAANLGASELQNQATSLEHDLHASKEDQSLGQFAQHADMLQAEFQRLAQAIAIALAKVQPT